MKSLSPVLLVENIKETTAFYNKLFNFEVAVYVPDEQNAVFAIMRMGEVEIMLQERKNMTEEYPILGDRESGGTFTLYMDLGEVKPLYEICKANNVTFVNDLHQTFYGADEFAILDNNGYILVLTKR